MEDTRYGYNAQAFYLEFHSQVAHAKSVVRPAQHERLRKAALLVIDGHVTLHANDTATVRSSDGTRAYHVNGRCDCPDAAERERLCKHRLAKRLLENTIQAILERQKVYTGDYTCFARDQRAFDDKDPVAQCCQPVLAQRSATMFGLGAVLCRL